MRKYLLITVLAVALFSCSDEDTVSDSPCFVDVPSRDCDWSEESYVGEVIPSKALKLVWSEDRSKYLFHGYKDSTTAVVVVWHSAGHCLDYTDDEWGEALYFELPAEATAFDYEDQALADLRCFHKESGAWINTAPAFITDGRVMGKQVDTEIWDISVMVNLPDSTSRGSNCFSYEGVFTVQ